MSGLAVRAATPADYDAICTLARELDRVHGDNLPGRFRRHDGPARTRSYVEGLIADDDTFLAVAELDGRLVGIINSGLGDTHDIPVKVARKFLRVRGIVVDPSFRHRGIGRALFDAATAWAGRRGAVEVQLTVYEFNETAQAFFAGLGFTPLSRRLTRPL